jgi:hypothetical protein
MIVAACNVNTFTAGTGSSSYGDYFVANETPAICASGYHLPTSSEWEVLLQEGYSAGLRDGSRTTTNIFSRSPSDLSEFQNTLYLPLAGDATTP